MADEESVTEKASKGISSILGTAWKTATNKWVWIAGVSGLALTGNLVPAATWIHNQFAAAAGTETGSAILAKLGKTAPAVIPT